VTTWWGSPSRTSVLVPAKPDPAAGDEEVPPLNPRPQTLDRLGFNDAGSTMGAPMVEGGGLRVECDEMGLSLADVVPAKTEAVAAEDEEVAPMNPTLRPYTLDSRPQTLHPSPYSLDPGPKSLVPGT